MNWFLNILGITNESGRWYAFWSGFAGDIPLIGAAYLLGRRHNCHVKGCWRIGRRKVEGTEHVVCSAHHPAGHVTAEQVAAEHHAHKVRLHHLAAEKSAAEQGNVTA